MKRLIPKSNPDQQYTTDVERIVRVCEERGHVIFCADAKEAWERFSALYSSGWLRLPPKDDELFEYVCRVCLVEEL